MVVFIHMSDFTLWSQPALAVTQETLKMLSTAFPESLGTCVILNPPAYFASFWKLVSGLIDPKTKAKTFMVHGDVSAGSPNDALLTRLLGAGWRELTGAGAAVLCKGWSEKHGREIDASPGFDMASYWEQVSVRAGGRGLMTEVGRGVYFSLKKAPSCSSYAAGK